MLVNSNTSFGSLKKTWVGNCYPPEFFDYIKNKKARQLTQRICEETLEDLETFKNKIKSFGVEIEQPDIVLTSKDAERMLVHGMEIPRPPLSPRDNYIVMGTTLYRFCNDASYDALFDKYKRAGADIFDPYNNPEQAEYLTEQEYNTWWSSNKVSSDELTKKNIMHPYQKTDADRKIRTHLYPAASINRCGNMMNIESLPHMLEQWSANKWNNKTIHHARTDGGMKDGRFSTIKRGLILTLQDLPEYNKTYPNWDVIVLPGQGNLAMKEKNSLLAHTHTKSLCGNAWYEHGILDHRHLNYVNDWVNYWVPYTKKHIVDVNAFSINEQNVILNGYNEELYSLLAEHNVTAHFVHYRHRYFWDGGHHCNTVDIVREDSNTDYISVDNNKKTTVIETLINSQ